MLPTEVLGPVVSLSRTLKYFLRESSLTCDKHMNLCNGLCKDNSNFLIEPFTLPAFKDCTESVFVITDMIACKYLLLCGFLVLHDQHICHLDRKLKHSDLLFESFESQLM